MQSMLDDELVEAASKRGSLGLADIMYKQLSREMGAEKKTTASPAADTAGAAGVKPADDKIEKKAEE
jgi:Rod binding domain-containing protein